jgi:hypothetical protein
VLLQHLNSVIRIPPTDPTMQPATGVTPAHAGDTKETIFRCSPYAHLPQPGKCSAPCHLTLLVINVEHLLRLFPGELSAPPPTSPFYDWMANNNTESFVGALCMSWVFYRDAQQRDEDTVYHPQFFARVSAPDQDTFTMRMSSEWFEAARRYTDSPSLGRCVHHVRGTTIKKALRKQVHQPKFTPKGWEFEMLTKLLVLGQQPAQTQEPRTHEITFFGPTLSTFDSPSGHYCAGIPKSKGERSNPIKRAGKLGTAKNDPRKKVKASAFMVQRDESKEEIEAPYRPIQDVPVSSPTKPTFTTRHTHANEGILTQLISELMAMHIGQNTHKSATMLVDSGASHILVRQEHAHVLTNVTMSPNGHAFASLKSAKKRSALSAIGKGVLQIGPFFLPTFIFSNDELEDTLLRLDPLTEAGCTAVFNKESFQLFHGPNTEPVLSGVKKLNQKAWKVEIHQPKTEMNALNGALESTKHSDKDYEHFVHASLGFPAPTTFMNAARKSFIKVAKHMPNAMATARGYLERKPASQPHSASQAASALKRLHAEQHLISKSSTSFDHTTVARSQTLHIDYTGRLQTICTSGIQYLQITCWDHYINIQPLTSMRAAQTTQAFTNSLTRLRMDNQWSDDLRDAATD